MRITKLGHACLYIVEQETALLIDPGAFSDVTEVGPIDAIFVTHDHFDHVDADTVRRLLDDNAGAVVYAEPDAVKLLADKGIEAKPFKDGDEVDIKGVRVQGVGTDHDPIHRDLPVMHNVGIFIAGRLFYPGDALTVPQQPVEILAQPTDGPWLKIEQTLDYLREIKPKVTIPVHEKTTAIPDSNYGLMQKFAEEQGTRYVNIDDGKPVDL